MNIRKQLTITILTLFASQLALGQGGPLTLEDVVAFYNAGGGEDENKDPRIKPLNLSETEQAQLVAFLKALSGEPLTGPDFVAEDIDTDYAPIENWQDATN